MGSMIENFDSLARLLLEALLNTLWQGMLIACLVSLLLRFIKRVSATTRHAVWLVTLLTIGALPLVAIVANRNVPTAPVKHEKQEKATPAVQTAPEANQPADLFSLDSGVARLTPGAIQDQSKGAFDSRRGLKTDRGPAPQIQDTRNTKLAEPRFNNGAVASSSEEAPVAVVSSATTSTRVERATLWQRGKSLVASFFSGNAPLFIVCLWLAVCALMSWRVARSYRAVFHLRGRLEPMPSEQSKHVRRLAGLFGIRRRVSAFTSGQIVMPMTIGSLKPLIIVPPDLAGELSQAEFESVVAHELAHIKRWDYLTNMLQRVVQAYLFFHPAVWFIGKQLMIERELACDDWAVKTCEPRRYASCLTKLVEALNESKPHMAVRVAATGIGGIIFGKNVISRRVEMILNRDRNATTAVSKPALLYAIGLVVMFVAVCSLISPVIAVPLGQNPARQSKKENKAPAPAKTQEFPPLPPVPPLPPEAALPVEPGDIPDIPDIPEPPEAPLPPVGPAAALSPDAGYAPFFDLRSPQRSDQVAALAPGAGLAPLPGGGAIGGIPGDIIARPVMPGQGARAVTVAPWPPEPPVAAFSLGQDGRKAEPAIPENELIGLLVDIVKKDADPTVRSEALQGLYRVRTDAGINALIQLYDGVSDVKTKGEIIPYLLRREGGSAKVDNSKAIAKLTAIAKSEQNEELRNKAIGYLGNVKGDEGADTLIQIYDTLQDQKMKRYVIRSLSQNRSRKAIDKLIQIAKNDSDPAVRQFAIQRLYSVGNYMELFGNGPARIGFVDGQSITPRPFVFRNNGELLEFDAKKWEEWQRDWQKNWEEQSEKLRETIEKIRIDGPIKLNIEDLQNRMRIELPRIEIQLKDLEDKIKLGYGFDRVSLVETQLRAQLASVESQLAATRAQYNDTHPKTAEVRNLRNALERQLNTVRSLRVTTPRPSKRVAPRASAVTATSSL